MSNLRDKLKALLDDPEFKAYTQLQKDYDERGDWLTHWRERALEAEDIVKGARYQSAREYHDFVLSYLNVKACNK